MAKQFVKGGRVRCGVRKTVGRRWEDYFGEWGNNNECHLREDHCVDENSLRRGRQKNFLCLSNRRFIISLAYHIVGFLHRWFIMSLVYYIVGLLHRWFIISLVSIVLYCFHLLFSFFR